MEHGQPVRTGQITKVERQEKHPDRYNIFIEGIYAFSVFEDSLIKFRLYKGQHVEENDILHIVKDDEFQKGYRTAIQWLSFRMRSEQEMLQYLHRKGFDKEISRNIALKLKEQGYIDDVQFALALTKQRALSQKKGRLYIRRELLYKGVSKQHASDALEQIDPAVEYQQALEIGLKKWNKLAERTRDNKRKIAAFLYRRGYPAGMIAKVLKELRTENDEDDHEYWDDEFY
jgi:regulatory protein